MCYQDLGPEEGATEQRCKFWSSSDLVKEVGEVCTDSVIQGGVASGWMGSTLN